MIRKVICIVAIAIQTISGSQAQYTEAGIQMGVSNYLGDLVPPRQFFLEGSFSIGGFFQYNLTNRISVRGSLLYGQLKGDDNNSNFDSGRRQRNLDFKTHLFELAVIGQVNLLPYQPKHDFRPVTPYGLLGIALFNFNPYTKYKGKDVYLQPLGTEGQGIDGYSPKYARWQISIPLGIGIKVCVNKHLHFHAEVGVRKTFTDYIDDVSGDYVAIQTLRKENGLQAANLSNRTYDDDGNQIERVGIPRGSAAKDWYSFMGVGLSYSFQSGRSYFRKKEKGVTHKKRKNNGGKWM